MSFLLDADDDWQEGFRRYWFPRLHPYLVPFGGYGTGLVRVNQYVGTFDEDEEDIEEELVAVGARRNPIACLKNLPDGRVSEGSWRFTHRTRPDVCEPGMQVHLTLFERADGKPGREVYAHYEDDWLADPFGHIKGTRFSSKRGVSKARAVIDAETYLLRI